MATKCKSCNGVGYTAPGMVCEPCGGSGIAGRGVNRPDATNTRGAGRITVEMLEAAAVKYGSIPEALAHAYYLQGECKRAERAERASRPEPTPDETAAKGAK